MKRDPIPTFRKAAHWMAASMRWANLRRVLIGSVAVFCFIAVVGEIAALTTRSACENRVRQKLTTVFGVLEWDDVRWYPPKLLRRVELPKDHFDRITGAGYGSYRIFRPRIVYVPDKSLAPVSSDPNDDHWAWVRPEATMPYVVRVHYSWGMSSLVLRGHTEASNVPSRYSRSEYGVATYLVAFGLSLKIDDWSTGIMWDERSGR